MIAIDVGTGKFLILETAGTSPSTAARPERRWSDMWDNMIHDIYSAMLPYKKLPCDAEVRCKVCGTPLKTYYAEVRLYLVKCGYCDTVTMVQAGSPFNAAAMVGEVVEE